jgi:hypothetical protein
MVPRGQRDGSLRPYCRFSRQEPLLFYQVAPQLYSRGWVDPVPDPLLFFVFVSAGNRTRTSGSVAKNSDLRAVTREANHNLDEYCSETQPLFLAMSPFGYCIFGYFNASHDICNIFLKLYILTCCYAPVIWSMQKISRAYIPRSFIASCGWKNQRNISKETTYIINKLTIGLLLTGRNSSPARLETLISPYRPGRLWGPPRLFPRGR